MTQSGRSRKLHAEDRDAATLAQWRLAQAAEQAGLLGVGEASAARMPLMRPDPDAVVLAALRGQLTTQGEQPAHLAQRIADSTIGIARPTTTR